MKSLNRIQIPLCEEYHMQESKKLFSEMKKKLIIPKTKIFKIEQLINQCNEIYDNQHELLSLGIKKDILRLGQYSLMENIKNEITDLFPTDIVYESMQTVKKYHLKVTSIFINKGLPDSAERYEDTNMYYTISEEIKMYSKYTKTISVFYAIEPCEKYPLACDIIQLYYLQLKFLFTCYDEEI